MTKRGRVILWAGVGLALAALGFIAFVAFVIFRTVDTVPSSAAQAEAAMASIRQRYAGRRPLLEIVDLRTRTVRVHPVAGRERRAVEALHFMVWDPSEQTLMQGQAPGWSIRLKLSLFGSGGWSLADFGLTPEDIERHVPGVLIDHRMPNGEHALIWVE